MCLRIFKIIPDNIILYILLIATEQVMVLVTYYTFTFSRCQFCLPSTDKDENNHITTISTIARSFLAVVQRPTVFKITVGMFLVSLLLFSLCSFQLPTHLLALRSSPGLALNSVSGALLVLSL